MRRGARAIAFGLVIVTGAAACQSLLDFKRPTAIPAESGVSDAVLESAPLADGDTDSCEATFCDDFDRGPLGARWDSKIIIPDGGMPGLTMELVDAAHSLPFAMRIAVPASNDGRRVAALERALGDGDLVTCAFDFYLEGEPVDPGRYADILTLGASGPDVAYGELYFAIDGAGPNGAFREDLGYTDGGHDWPVQKTKQVVPLPPPGWSRIEFETDFFQFSLRYGPSEILTNAPLRGFKPSNIRVFLGVWNNGPSATSARFDNVVCNVTNRTDAGTRD